MRFLTHLILATALVAAAPTDDSRNAAADNALDIAPRDLVSVHSSEGSMASEIDAASDDSIVTDDLAEVNNPSNADDAEHRHPKHPATNDACTKDEVGCGGGGEVLTLMFPIIGIIKGILHHHRDRLTLYRFDAPCEGDGGKQIHDSDHLEKGKCKDWEKAPDGPMSMNYILPKNKAFNHCNIYMFQQHHCKGEPFNVLYGRDDVHGNSTVQTLNAQNYCHEVSGMKSISIGPCS